MTIPYVIVYRLATFEHVRIFRFFDQALSNNFGMFLNPQRKNISFARFNIHSFIHNKLHPRRVLDHRQLACRRESGRLALLQESQAKPPLRKVAFLAVSTRSVDLHKLLQSFHSHFIMQVNTLPYSGWSRLTLCACLAVILAGQSASATYTCDTSLGNYYSYCVNVPDGASSSTLLPTILFLSGSGARNSGSSSNVKSLVSRLSSRAGLIREITLTSLSYGCQKSGYDGFGKKINEYLSGNKGADQTMAATQ